MNDIIRILLVEDEPAILRGLIAAIRNISDQFEVIDTAYNGQEAREKIPFHQPDIVITDIQMPYLDGLELIEQCKPLCPDTTFIILTGFAEFDYAQKALQLGVKDYLLKPVDPDLLETLLQQLAKEILQNSVHLKYQYIRYSLTHDSKHETMDNPLSDCHLFLLFTFWGPISTNLYNELRISSQLAHENYDLLIHKISAKYKLEILSFPGNYLNEKIFALISQNDAKENAPQAAAEIYQTLQTDEIPINCILSAPITNGREIQAQVRNCYFFSAFHSVFGQHNLFTNYQDSFSKDSIRVSASIEELSGELTPLMPEPELHQLCHAFINFWKETSTTQFQLQTDIRYIINMVSKKNATYSGTLPDPAEIIVSSNSYTELFSNLFLELKEMYASGKTIQEKSKHINALALEIRNYLDTHYTQQVTHKDFTAIWGYNEKYISQIFKENFQISPSKYIVQLRLSAAKELMKQNPNALLKDIAEAVGYEDQLYFSRVFKNSEGISPKAFQKSVSATPE